MPGTHQARCRIHREPATGGYLTVRITGRHRDRLHIPAVRRIQRYAAAVHQRRRGRGRLAPVGRVMNRRPGRGRADRHVHRTHIRPAVRTERRRGRLRQRRKAPHRTPRHRTMVVHRFDLPVVDRIVAQQPRIIRRSRLIVTDQHVRCCVIRLKVHVVGHRIAPIRIATAPAQVHINSLARRPVRR